MGAFQLELLKWWQHTEDHVKAEETIEQFKRDVLISPLRLAVPDIYDRLFTEGYMPTEEIDEATGMGMFTPTTPEEFDQMFEEWADLGPLDLSGVFQEEVTPEPEA